MLSEFQTLGNLIVDREKYYFPTVYVSVLRILHGKQNTFVANN